MNATTMKVLSHSEALEAQSCTYKLTCTLLAQLACKPYSRSEALEPLLQVAFYAFPTLQQLAKASEEDLRADGFGYRYTSRFQNCLQQLKPS